ncbi:MAG: sigma-70 family RNA polymerase sigma factor [Candidatus Coatesbacteria bacterium]
MGKDLDGLLIAARGGDAAAYEEIVRRFQRMAIAYGAGVLRDFHLAQDVAQEAFVEAYFKLGALRNLGAFPAWLRKIIFKHCDRRMRRKKLQVVPIDDDSVIASTSPGPAERAEEMEVRKAVSDAIDSLPKGERVVTFMFYMEDRPHAEIAEFLGLPTSTVKSRLHSARGRLKEHLMTLVEHEVRGMAPDPGFSHRIADAIRVYAMNGPAHDQMRSVWHRQVVAKVSELLRSGEEGFRMAVELSRSPHAKVRAKAALHFGLSRDQRGREHLAKLLEDENVVVRRGAIRSYASLLGHSEGYDFENSISNQFRTWAEKVPDGIESLIACLKDPIVKNRWVCVLALRPYARLKDVRVDAAFQRAAKDEKHKIRHVAALSVKGRCAECGCHLDSSGAIISGGKPPK